MEKVVDEARLKKYVLLHRLEVSAILYLVIMFTSKLSDSPDDVKLLLYPILAYYIVFPRYLDSKIPFNEKTYKAIMIISGAISYGWLGGLGVLRRINVFSLLGWNWWNIELLVCCNALFSYLHVFKVRLFNGRMDPRYEKEYRKLAYFIVSIGFLAMILALLVENNII